MCKPIEYVSRRDSRRLGISLARGVMTSLATILLSACSSTPYAVPPNTPTSIAAHCSNLAGLGIGNASADVRVPSATDMADGMPGSADNTIEDARQAEQQSANKALPSDVVFYRCLVSNGIVLEPSQQAVLDDWKESSQQ